MGARRFRYGPGELILSRRKANFLGFYDWLMAGNFKKCDTAGYFLDRMVKKVSLTAVFHFLKI